MCDSASMVVSDDACITPPTTCSGRSRVSGKTAQAFSSASVSLRSARAVEAEDLGGGDDADQSAQVVAVGGEVVGQRSAGRRRRRVGLAGRPRARPAAGPASAPRRG